MDLGVIIETEIKKALQAQQIILDKQFKDLYKDVVKLDTDCLSDRISPANDRIEVLSCDHSLVDINDVYNGIRHRCNYYVVREYDPLVVDLQRIVQNNNVFTVLDLEERESGDIINSFSTSNSHSNFLYYYDNQLLIYSATEIDHKSHLTYTSEILSRLDIDAYYNKGQLAQHCVEFNYFLVSEHCVSPCKTTIDIITQWAVPEKLFQLIDFVNRILVFEHVINDFEFVAKPLIDIASSYCECDDLSINIILTAEQLNSFRMLRKSFVPREERQIYTIKGTERHSDNVSLLNQFCVVSNNLSCTKNTSTEGDLDLNEEEIDNLLIPSRDALNGANYFCDADPFVDSEGLDGVVKETIEIYINDSMLNSVTDTQIEDKYRNRLISINNYMFSSRINNYWKTHPPPSTIKLCDTWSLVLEEKLYTLNLSNHTEFSGFPQIFRSVGSNKRVDVVKPIERKIYWELNIAVNIYHNSNCRFNSDLLIQSQIFNCRISNNLHRYWKLYHPPKRIKSQIIIFLDTFVPLGRCGSITIIDPRYPNTLLKLPS